MLFNSYIFLFAFLPAVLLLFFSVARFSHRGALGVLFFASLIFYGWVDYHYVLPLLFSITINFFIAKRIHQSFSPRVKKQALLLGLLFNLGLLGYYKYMDFFIENINTLTSANFSLLHIALPLGISFFTFTQIAFLVDCYRGLVQQCRPLNYALFVTYFPHLIAGPIIHHKEVMPQFEKKRTFHFNYRNFTLGLGIFAIGLFKKTVLADYLATLVIPIFDVSLPHLSTTDAWIAAVAYTFELYFDFSGYSDMAIGLSLLIGIKLPVNFFSPYKSLNIIEFWRRWNMTLSRFLRDYFYISLGGNRHGALRRYGNLMLTMLLGGLWHGANWTFVLWGLLHGTYLCLNHAFIALKRYLGLQASGGRIATLLSGGLTFLVVVVAWVLFRAPDFKTATTILKAMFLQGVTLPSTLPLPFALKALLEKCHVSFTTDPSWVTTPKAFILLMVASAVIWFMPNTYQFFKQFKPAFLPYTYHDLKLPKALLWKPRLVWNYAMVAILVLGILHIHASNIFLYFQF